MADQQDLAVLEPGRLDLVLQFFPDPARNAFRILKVSTSFGNRCLYSRIGRKLDQVRKQVSYPVHQPGHAHTPGSNLFTLFLAGLGSRQQVLDPRQVSIE